MFFIFSSLTVSYRYTIYAINKTDDRIPFAEFDLDESTRQIKPTVLTQENYPTNSLKFYEISTPEGRILRTHASSHSNTITFKLTVTTSKIPIGFEIKSSSGRKSQNRVSIVLNQPKVFDYPHFQQIHTQQSEGPQGILGILQKFWYIPLILFIAPRLFGGGQQPQQQQH